MTDLSPTGAINQELREALSTGNLSQAAALLDAGAAINARNPHGESLLHDVMGSFQDDAERRIVVSFMLDHGADPRLLAPDGSGPLFSAVIAQDASVLQLLLDHGADPNREHDDGEALYDFAEFDYRFEAYELNLPEKPDDADKATEDAWLEYLDRLALKYGKPRPACLRLLRERGALTRAEQQRLPPVQPC